MSHHTAILPEQVNIFPDIRNEVANLRAVSGGHTPEINAEEKDTRIAAHVIGNVFYSNLSYTSQPVPLKLTFLLLQGGLKKKIFV